MLVIKCRLNLKTHVGVELGGDLLGLVCLVVSRELVEDGPAPPPTVVVVGRRRLGVPVRVGVLGCNSIDILDTSLNLSLMMFGVVRCV